MKLEAICTMVVVLMLFALHCNGAVYCPDNASSILNGPSSSTLSFTNSITVMFRHTIGVSNTGGNYISRQATPFRLKTSGVAPQQFDFVYTDFAGANHQWRTTAESYNVQGHNLTACTFTYGTGSSFLLYTNGIVQGGSWIAGDGNVLATNSVSLVQMWGHGAGAGGQIGYYSDFAVWNSILSQQQIDLIRKSKVKGIQLQINPSTLKMWIPLDGWPDGKVVPAAASALDIFRDRSGNDNHFDSTGAFPTGMAERVCSYQPNE